MQSKNTIEVNGRRYDAITGALLGPAAAPPIKAGGAVDGFFRSRAKAEPAAEKVAVRVASKPKPAAGPAPKIETITVRKVEKRPEPAVVATTPKPKVIAPQIRRTVNHAKAHAPQAVSAEVIHKQSFARRQKRNINHARAHAPQSSTVQRDPIAEHRKHKLASLHSPANHTKARPTQDSLTLMRSVVQRPALSLHKQTNPVGALQHSVPGLIALKPSVNTVDESRLARAQSTGRSPHISHHAAAAEHFVQPTLAPLAVQPVPVKPEGEEPKPAPSPQPTNKPTDIFEHALANAGNFVDIHAHRAHLKKQARRHLTSMAAGTLALLVIAGFAAYQNTPGLQFKVASIQAGVTTSMPDFQGAGFAYNGVRAGNGALDVGFSNNAGKYELTQTNTNFSSQDMIASIGATDAGGTPNYRTLQADGTTVYRFDNTGATWVSGGKWYTVSGNSALTDSQIESLIRNV